MPAQLGPDGLPIFEKFADLPKEWKADTGLFTLSWEVEIEGFSDQEWDEIQDEQGVDTPQQRKVDGKFDFDAPYLQVDGRQHIATVNWEVYQMYDEEATPALDPATGKPGKILEIGKGDYGIFVVQQRVYRKGRILYWNIVITLRDGTKQQVPEGKLYISEKREESEAFKKAELRWKFLVTERDPGDPTKPLAGTEKTVVEEKKNLLKLWRDALIIPA